MTSARVFETADSADASALAAPAERHGEALGRRDDVGERKSGGLRIACAIVASPEPEGGGGVPKRQEAIQGRLVHEASRTLFGRLAIGRGQRRKLIRLHGAKRQLGDDMQPDGL